MRSLRSTTHPQPVLFVDDSPRDTEIALAALKRYRLANPVVAVRDGVEALDFLESSGAWSRRPAEAPALVLLDLRMPRMDGIEVLHRMRSIPDLATIPVIVMTSSREESDMLASYGFNVVSYVVKPVDFAGVLEAIRPLDACSIVLESFPAQGGDAESPCSPKAHEA